MKGKQLEEVNSEKDLGVIILSNLKVADHCRHAYATANRMLGLLSQTVKFRNVDIMVRLYKSLVRPHLKYSTSIWNPHYEKDKVLLEKVQRRFTRLFKDLRSREYNKKIKDSKVMVIGGKTPSFRFARTFQDGPWALCNSSNVVFQTG